LIDQSSSVRQEKSATLQHAQHLRQHHNKRAQGLVLAAKCVAGSNPARRPDRPPADCPLALRRARRDVRAKHDRQWCREV